MKNLMKNKDFSILLIGQSIGKFGTSIIALAFPWLILEMTGSAFMMGIISAISFIPYLFFSMISGVWADNFDRKKMMQVANALRIVFTFSIPLSSIFLGQLYLVHIIIVRLVMSSSAAIYDSAYGAILPNIVSKEQLKSANSAMQTGIALSRVLGPGAAGLLISLIGVTNTIIVDGFAYLISFISLFLIKKNLNPSNSKKKGKNGNMYAQIKEGLSYVWDHSVIRTLSVLTLLANLANSSVGILIIYRVEQELGMPSSVAGLIMSCFSLGALFGSIASVTLMNKMKINAMLKTLLLIQIFPPIVIALTNNSIVFGLATFIMGCVSVIWNIQSLTIRQLIVPNELLGRANSSIRVVSWISSPIGSAGGGAIGQIFGGSVAFVLIGTIRAINFLYAGKRLDLKTFNLEQEQKTKIKI